MATMVCVHRGGNGDENLYWSTFDGSNWSADTPLGNGAQSAAGPAIAVYNGQLFCVHRGEQGDASLWWSVYDPATQSWGEDTQFDQGNETNCAPAVYVYQGTLFCVHKGNADNNLWFCSYDPGSGNWSQDTQFSQGNCTASQPALTEVGGNLMCVHAGAGDINVWWCEYNGNWTGDGMMPMQLQTSTSVGATTWQGTAICAFGGQSGMQEATFDGSSTWTPSSAFSNGNCTAAAPAFASFDNTLYCVHIGGQNENSEGNAYRNAMLGSVGASFINPLWGAAIQTVADTGGLGRSDTALYFTTLVNGTWATDIVFSAGNQSNDSPALAVVDFAM